jgi:hypothetical protein
VSKNGVSIYPLNIKIMKNYDPKTDLIEKPTWNEHIHLFFREEDIAAMRFFCDLGAYEDVKKYKSKIYERLITPKGERGMPADGPWKAVQIQTFHNWAENGAPRGDDDLV